MPSRFGRGSLGLRGLTIAATTFAYLLPAAAVGLMLAVWRGRPVGRRHFYHSVVRLLQRLGPTFVKFGQIMSARRDVLPPILCDELAVLHDSVQPMSEAEIRWALAATSRDASETRFAFEQLSLVASGSVASVFRATDCDGTEVAVKLQRRGIAQLMWADLALMEGLVRMTERLPKCQGMPLGNLMAYMSTAIIGQLDFAREAINLSRIRADLSAIPGVRVPAVRFDASGPGCLVMEFIPELDCDNVNGHTLEVRRQLATTTLLVVRQMIFVNGFVHCDLHPGNLYVTPGADVVILDAGFSVQLSDRVRRLIAEFFTGLSVGNGRRCAEIVIESAAAIRPGTDLEGFINGVVALVDSQAGPAAVQFSMMRFGNALFDLQREYGLYAESDFAFPLMSLAVIESTVRALSPDLDFQELGRLDERVLT